MLLTLSKPPKPDFDFKSPHDYSVRTPYSVPRLSPKVLGGILNSLPDSTHEKMSAPHRGLPPPSAMTLPEPTRGPPPSISQPLGHMPAPPSQWQGAEDGMRNWLAAKAEEDRRKQEEERTQQEALRLEQRKIEQNMLRESIQGGVPPHMVPMIFAGIGGGTLSSLNMEWLQQYLTQLQTQQQHQQQQAAQAHVSTDHQQNVRSTGQPPAGTYPGAPQPSQSVMSVAPIIPSQAVPAAHFSTFASTGVLSPIARARSLTGPSAQLSSISGSNSLISAPRQAQTPVQSGSSLLPRLTTGEMLIQPPPVASASIQQSQVQETQQSSPSIHFHHWVPPATQNSGGASTGVHQPATPSGKHHTSPPSQHRHHHHHTASHASDSDYTSSPKKRKAQGSHQAVPPPTSAPQYVSPSFTHISSSSSTPARRGHGRTRSDASTRLSDVTPGSRSGPRSTTISNTSPQLEGGAPTEAERRSMLQPSGEGARNNEGWSYQARSGTGGASATTAFQAETRPPQYPSVPATLASPKREAGGH